MSKKQTHRKTLSDQTCIFGLPHSPQTAQISARIPYKNPWPKWRLVQPWNCHAYTCGHMHTQHAHPVVNLFVLMDSEVSFQLDLNLQIGSLINCSADGMHWIWLFADGLGWLREITADHCLPSILPLIHSGESLFSSKSCSLHHDGLVWLPWSDKIWFLNSEPLSLPHICMYVFEPTCLHLYNLWLHY